MYNNSRALILTILLCCAFIEFNVFAEEYSYPAEISGKILDKDEKPFLENVTVVITANILTDSTDYTGDSYKHIEYKQNVTGGIFSWKGQAYNITIQAEKDGYHSDLFYIFLPPGIRGNEIKSNDILIYMVPKGTPSKLEYTEGAEIPSKKKSGGKQCGWSFNKRWYFPVDEEETVWMTRSRNEDGKVVYTMKEPGGFVYFPGYPHFESKPNEHWANFDLMPEAPESGYVQSISPSDYKDQQQRQTYSGIYYYFKTPDGKYGKIVFDDGGYFDYYLQPDGSRNLEAGEVIRKGPRNPIEAEWLDKELGEDN